MLLSDDPPFLFFAMNKTGSTSIEEVLRPYDRWVHRNVLRARYYLRPRDAIFRHAAPVDVRDLVARRRWERSFTFCFVRNPFDRLVSIYHFHRQGGQKRHPLASEVGFEEWLERGGTGSAGRSQAAFVSDRNGSCVLDFVGRFESIERDVERVLDTLGIEGHLPRRNPSQHRHYTEYYSDRARAIVERRFRDDLERFGYAFGETTPTPVVDG